ncbi:MAG: methylase [Anaerocolumna sp.]|jgi:tRNA G10  N-methylase Trm11|nr:methylase [Anaerocolumna sp.]
MIRDTFDNILQEKEVRQNLIQLKAELKEESARTALLYQIGGRYSVFEKLLINDDAKVRKNTAIIMGILNVPCFLDMLYDAYQKEEQLFVKSSYLDALKNFDYESLLPELKEKLQILSNLDVSESDRKHVNEEIRSLSDLIINIEGPSGHLFTGYQVPSELILLTNRNFVNITMDQIKGNSTKEFNAGVMVKCTDLNDILPIRTYNELLFVLKDLKTCGNDVGKAASAIANSSLMEFLEKLHKGSAPFYFRIELKSKMELDKKSAFTKKLGMEIERLTKRSLINSTSNYEVELRLIENKEGNYNVLIKLYTLKDERFSYRKNVIATSIQPVNAALIVALSKNYLIEDAQVLDPFCGVGTMLIERHKLVHANTMFGLDTFGEAIEKGKENAKNAKTIAHFVNRDFFDFKHDYLFDEIITNMPRVMGHKEEEEIYQIYHKFFIKASEHLKQNGIMILYSHNREFIKKLMNKKIYKIEEEYEINKREGTYLFIIRYI